MYFPPHLVLGLESCHKRESYNSRHSRTVPIFPKYTPFITVLSLTLHLDLFCPPNGPVIFVALRIVGFLLVERQFRYGGEMLAADGFRVGSELETKRRKRAGARGGGGVLSLEGFAEERA